MALATDAAPPAPRRTIVARRSWLPADPRELWQFRALLGRFAARDVTLRYRQTALGVIWVLLQPLLAAGALSFVFGSVANIPGPAGIPYFVFSLTGMVAWTAYSQVTTRASGSLVGNAGLISKVFFPRLLLPLSTVTSSLVDIAVSIGLLAVVMASTGTAPGIALLSAPLWLGLMVAGGLGIALIASGLMVLYRDVQYVLPVAVQFLLYASPVAYPLSQVPSGTRSYFELNPLTGLLEAFRWAVLGTTRPAIWLTAYASLVAVAAFVAGVLVFSRMERRFADVI